MWLARTGIMIPSILSLPICIIFSSPPRQKARRCGTEKGPDHFLSVHSFLSPTFCLASHPIHNRFSSCCKEQKVHGREKGALLRGWGRGDGASSTHLRHAATASVWQPHVTGKQSDLPFSFFYPADPFTFLPLPPSSVASVVGGKRLLVGKRDGGGVSGSKPCIFICTQ